MSFDAEESDLVAAATIGQPFCPEIVENPGPAQLCVLPRATVANQAAQPAMGRIGIQPRVPEQPNRNLRRVDRKDKAVHHFAQVSGVSFGNIGDQIGRSSQGQRASSRSLPRLRDVLSHARAV
jgi:hypothetical protein